LKSDIGSSYVVLDNCNGHVSVKKSKVLFVKR